jgi:ElaB/YqjD/DUF883 family membrane-anchored ribosome-binding protein
MPRDMSEGHDNPGGSATEEFRGKASQVGKNIREMGGQIADVAREQYEGLRDHASHYVEKGKQKAHEWQEGVEEYVYEKPLRSLLIAAGAGLLLGLWLRRR